MRSSKENRQGPQNQNVVLLAKKKNPLVLQMTQSTGFVVTVVPVATT